MKFQLFSDIHIELIKRKFKDIPVESRYLILAGDIGKIGYPNFIEFIQYCSSNWEQVIYVFGNHEFYGSHSIETIRTRFIEFFKTFPNVHLLDNTSIQIEDVTIYGFTGWTLPIFDNSTVARNYLNDYNMIKTSKGKLRIEDHAIMANEQIEKFKEFIDEVESDKIMIVTHFPPIRNGTSDPMYMGDILNAYFSWNNMLIDNNIITNKIKIWCSGHTHFSYDFIFDNIRYVSNQVGYENEGLPYNNGVFEI